MHLVLSEMPKHILYGFQLFLPKGKVAHKTSAVSDLLGTLRDLKWHYKSVFKEQDPPPVCLCCKVVRLLRLSFEFLQPELSSVLLLLSEFVVNSSKHISPAVSEVSVEQACPEEVINTPG